MAIVGFGGRAEPSAAEDVYRQFRHALVTGQFPPGTHLSERKLGEEFQVSRTPVREALRRLQSDGLVHSAARGGVVVKTLSSREAHDVYQTRAALEALCARLAAERMRGGHLAPVQINQLTVRAEAVDAAANAGDAHLASLENLRFHKLVTEMADNTFAMEALDRLWNRIAVSSLSNLTDPVWNAEVHDHHQQIIAAISVGDPATASRAMCVHIERAIDVYIDHGKEHDNVEPAH